MRRSSLSNGIIAVAIAAVCVVALPYNARANDLGLQMGYYFDSEAISLGFGMLTPISDEPRWYFNPNAELIMGDQRDMAAFSADFHYDFATDDNLTFWAGAGPGLYVINRPFDDEDFEPGLNLLAGFGAITGDVRPFVQGKLIFMDDSEGTIAVGIRY